MANIMDELLGVNAPLTADTSALSSLKAPQMTDPEQEAWKRRHSGVGGVARDIFGSLGDFLLSRLHMGTPYADSQKQHKLNYAAQGLNSGDPQEALHALDEIQKVDFNTGVKLRDQFIDNQRLAAAQASTAEARAARLQMAQDAANSKVRGYAASMIGTMAGWDDDKRKQYYPQVRQQVLTAAKKQGLDLSGELPEEYDPVALDAFTGAAVPVSMQRAQALTKDKMAQQNEQFKQRDETTRRGQDFNHEDKAASRAVTMRGQDLSHGDRQASIAASNSRNQARIAAKPAKAPKPTAADLTYLRQNPGARDKFDGRFGVGMAKRVLGN